MGCEIGDASVVVAIHPPSVRARIRVLRLVNRKVKLLGFRWSGKGSGGTSCERPRRPDGRVDRQFSAAPHAGPPDPVRSARRRREGGERGWFGDDEGLGATV